MGTVAQEWMEQGKVEGRVETFLRQARLKFKAIADTHVEQIYAASQDQLDIWLDALILAEDLDEVFTIPTRHSPARCDRSAVMITVN